MTDKTEMDGRGIVTIPCPTEVTEIFDLWHLHKVNCCFRVLQKKSSLYFPKSMFYASFSSSFVKRVLHNCVFQYHLICTSLVALMLFNMCVSDVYMFKSERSFFFSKQPETCTYALLNLLFCPPRKSRFCEQRKTQTWQSSESHNQRIPLHFSTQWVHSHHKLTLLRWRIFLTCAASDLSGDGEWAHLWGQVSIFQHPYLR